MRKIFVFGLVALLNLLYLSGQEKIKWIGIKEALILSQKEPRKIIIDVYTDWCGWCKVMDRTTFMDTNIIKYINENFYAVKFNAEQKEDITLGDKTYKYVPSGTRGYHELAAVLLNGKLGYPSTVVIDEKAAIIDIRAGYLKPSVFDTILNFYGGNHHNTTTLTEFTKSYVSPAMDPQ